MKQRQPTTSLEAIQMDHAARQAINSKPYDGLHGTLPPWVPDFFRQLFDSFRDELARSTEHKPAKIVAWIAAYPKEHEARDTHAGRGVTLIPSALKDRVSMLAWIHVAVTLAETQGQDAGMRYLLGPGPAKAYAADQKRIPGLKKAAAKRRSDALKKHAPTFAIAASLQSENRSVRWIAKETARKLGCPDDWEKIRDILRENKKSWGKRLSAP